MDAKCKAFNGLVETDRFIELLLSQYAKLSQKNASAIEELFLAADVRLIQRKV